MEFDHELARWHHIREFAEMLAEHAEFREIRLIRKCIYYEWDNQSAEEYCYCPALIVPPLATVSLNGKSEEICFKCPHYKTDERSTFDGGIISVPQNLLKGCHNCRWNEKDANRCNDGNPHDCNWENDGTYHGSEEPI